MRGLLLAAVISLIFFNASAQITDIAPSGYQNRLAVEGGSIPMKIDAVTSLDSLIARLKGNWQLIETGKAYWIGYTNDMFSIAARGDSAVQPLIDLFESSLDSKTNAAYGAMLTAHLIGIERKIAGRFYEEFTNVKARKALLYLLKYPRLQDNVMTLLIRDPWFSDVPELFQTMMSDTTDSWGILAGLIDYRLKNAPTNTSIPDNLGKLIINYKPAKDFTEEILQNILMGIRNLKNDSIVIDEKLFGSKIWGATMWVLMRVAEAEGDRGLS